MLVIRTERHPLVVFEFRDGFEPEDVDHYTAYMDERFAKRERIASVVAAIDLPMPTVTALKHMGAWVKERSAELGEYNLGTGLVLESAVLRGALRFVNTLAPSPSPQAVFGRYREAEAWAIARLRGAGLEPGLAKVG